MFKPNIVNNNIIASGMIIMSNSVEVFRIIEAIQAEFKRLKQVERDYQKLQEEYDALRTKVEKEKAEATSVKAEPFRFNLGSNQSVNYTALNLDEFENVLKVVPVESLEFHMNRGDFEAWLKFIGSEDLALVFSSIRNENLSGEALRKRLLEVFLARSRAIKAFLNTLFLEDRFR